MIGRGLAAVGALAALGAVLAGGPPAMAAGRDECPNAALRALQRAQNVAECRAFEQVSPADKAGADVSLIGTVQSATQAGAAAYTSPQAFPGGQTSVAIGVYRSVRGADGWTTLPVDLPQANGNDQIVTPTPGLSSDLSRAVGVSRRALTPDATEGFGNLYVSDLDAGTRRLMVGSPAPAAAPGMFYDFSGNPGAVSPFVGASADARHLVFQVNEALVPGAVAGIRNAYEWVDGQLRLINVMPDGTPSTKSAELLSTQSVTPRAVSADGSKIWFRIVTEAGTNGPLYLRQDGTTTRLVSRSRRAGDDPAQPRRVEYVAANADGSIVYFSALEPLTEDAPTDPQSKLYRYVAATDELTVVNPAPPLVASSQIMTILAVSEDGQRAFFLSYRKLTADAADDTYQLYVADHGTIKLVGPIGGAPSPFAISPDGRYGALADDGPTFGHANLSPECRESWWRIIPDGSCREVYGFDLVTGARWCLSCRESGPSLGHAGMGPQAPTLSQHSIQSVLADGTVFFDTPNPLVPADVNRRQDVYSWRLGEPRPRLVTTGLVDGDVQLRDVSPDGTDVYFTTSVPLVGQDRDENRDLYTARREGGLWSQEPAPAAPACDGVSCQGPRSDPPVLPGVVSMSFAGLGNAGGSTSRPPAKPASASLRVAAGRTSRGVSTTVRVAVRAAGTIRVSGRSVRLVRRRVGKAGTYRVRVVLTPAARRVLARGGRLRAGVTVTFAPQRASSVSRRVAVTFAAPRRSAARGR